MDCNASRGGVTVSIVGGFGGVRVHVRTCTSARLNTFFVRRAYGASTSFGAA